MSETNDKHLLFSQVAAGDKQAFDTFFDRYYAKLVQFAGIFVHDEPQAEDIVADVLTRMLVHRERVFRLPHIEAYLYASVKNRALSSLKKQERVTYFSQQLPPLTHAAPVVASPYEVLVTQELHRLIDKTIQALPPKRRMVFQLLREEDLSYRQVADLMEISERTVEVHLRLAIKTLRQVVEHYLGQQETKEPVLNWVKVGASLLLFYFFP